MEAYWNTHAGVNIPNQSARGEWFAYAVRIVDDEAVTSADSYPSVYYSATARFLQQRWLRK